MIIDHNFLLDDSDEHKLSRFLEKNKIKDIRFRLEQGTTEDFYVVIYKNKMHDLHTKKEFLNFLKKTITKT